MFINVFVFFSKTNVLINNSIYKTLKKKFTFIYVFSNKQINKYSQTHIVEGYFFWDPIIAGPHEMPELRRLKESLNRGVSEAHPNKSTKETHCTFVFFTFFPMNYQLDQNRVFKYQRQPFSPHPSVKGVKTNGQRVT
jgi:hypothetical protein